MGGVSLLNFCKEDACKEHIIETSLLFLKDLKKGSCVLMLGLGDKKFDEVIKKKKIDVVSFYGNLEDLNKISSEFFKAANKSFYDRFDAVLDLNFSHYLQKDKIVKFYRVLSRIAKYGSRMLSFVFSSRSPYCKTHCPKRQWTYVDDIFVKYFTKDEISRLVTKSFIIDSYKLVSFTNSDVTYHQINSTMNFTRL